MRNCQPKTTIQSERVISHSKFICIIFYITLPTNLMLTAPATNLCRSLSLDHETFIGASESFWHFLIINFILENTVFRNKVVVRRLKSGLSKSQDNIWMPGKVDSFNSRTWKKTKTKKGLEIFQIPTETKFQYYFLSHVTSPNFH